MVVTPHILERRSDAVVYDNDGVASLTSTWEPVSKCRCDSDSSKTYIGDAGKEYRSKYHVVSERNSALMAGDNVRCLDKDGVNVGEGMVQGEPKRSQVFNIMEFWL